MAYSSTVSSVSEGTHMNMCAFIDRIKTLYAIVATQLILTHPVTINVQKLDHPNIDAKTRIELRPLSLDAFLYDVVRLSAPMINENSLYYLHKPNGDVIKLDVHIMKHERRLYNTELSTIVAKYVNNIKPIISQNNNYDVFSIKRKSLDGDKDVFSKKVKEMDDNDFMIGPLSEDDHGNWVLSVYTKDINDTWIELFQVITIKITEYVPVTPVKPVLNTGDTFNLSFVIPVANLESCELVAPRSTFDRLFNRSWVDMSTCGFTVPNVTQQDMGLWRIIGVSRIVYEGDVYLTVNLPVENNK